MSDPIAKIKKKLQDEINLLEHELQHELPREIRVARAHGDLSENAEYHAAKERQGWIEGQIADIEDKMARAQVIDVSKLSGKQVKFGATVSVVDEDTEEEGEGHTEDLEAHGLYNLLRGSGLVGLAAMRMDEQGRRVARVVRPVDKWLRHLPMRFVPGLRETSASP